MAPYNPLQEKLRDLLAANKTEQVLSELEKVTKSDKELSDSFVILNSKYQNLKKHEMLGLTSFSDSNLEKNRITAALLELIGQLPETDNYSFTEFAEKNRNISNPNILYQQNKRIVDFSEREQATKTILFISSNPRNLNGLRFGKEFSTIQAAINAGTQRDNFNLVSEMAAQPEEILRFLKKYRPAIVHIACHGSKERGLFFEDAEGAVIPISSDILASFFELINIRGKIVECLVLSACESTEHAKAVNNFVDRTIGMAAAIPDDFAVSYTKGFYTDLAEGGTYEDAHEHGRSMMKLAAQKLEYDGAFPLLEIPVIFSIEHWKKSV